MKNASKPWVAPLVAGLVAFLLCFTQPLYALDMLLCDPLYSQARTPSRDMIVVGIDEETLAEYGSFSSWSREKTADLLDVLFENPDDAPSLVALDINFQGETDPAADEALASAAEGRPVVVAGSLVFRGQTVKGSDGQAVYDAWNVESVEEPYPALAANVESGYSNAIVAPDGIVRETLPNVTVDGKPEESFSYLVYRLRSEAAGGSAALPETVSNGSCEFFYAGAPSSFAHVSFADVVEGRVPTSEFRDKTVFVGAWASGMQDAYAVASKRGGTMYGVEINANIVQALEDGATATPAPPWAHALILGALCAAIVALVRRRPLALQIGAAVALAAAHLLAGRLLASAGITISQVYALIACALMIVYFIIDTYVLERIRRRRALAVFSQYIEPKVVESLSTEQAELVQLGGELRQVSVLFVDIRGFTTMSEGMEPPQVVEILNEYLGLVTECIFRHGGMLDKFVGDAAMAVFNAPFDQEDYLYESVAAAWDIAQGSAQLADTLQQRFGRTIGYGIGVNCGPAVVGNIGCEFRMDYTAIGDTVNTAARLEANAPRDQIYISRALADALEGRILTEEVGALQLKGKAEPFPVLRVTGLVPDATSYDGGDVR